MAKSIGQNLELIDSLDNHHALYQLFWSNSVNLMLPRSSLFTVLYNKFGLCCLVACFTNNLKI